MPGRNGPTRPTAACSPSPRRDLWSAANGLAGEVSEEITAWSGASTLGELVFSDELAHLMRRCADPDRSATSEVFTVAADREKARFSAWYEMFPRSASPEPRRHGTFADVRAKLPYVAHMGFDVLYLPPIHPIGRTGRKGPDGATNAAEGDPGSPWAIGAREGGHTAVHPELGTLEEFRDLVTAAAARGIEVAIDLAFQASPDHPWVTEHPEWFRHLPDGTIRYAENPPKRYEDIYPLDFETADWQALWTELLEVVRFWVVQGVKVFRVDNPHTKPFAFWEWMIRLVKADHPEVIFLSEAFTRPRVMEQLAKVGFTQSYTYFTWRNTKWELETYLDELTKTDVADYFRPNFWPNTPDILHEELQNGGRAAFLSRLRARRHVERELRDLRAGLRAAGARSPLARLRGVRPLREVRDPLVGSGPAGQPLGIHRPGEQDPPGPSGPAVQRRPAVSPHRQRADHRLLEGPGGPRRRAGAGRAGARRDRDRRQPRSPRRAVRLGGARSRRRSASIPTGPTSCTISSRVPTTSGKGATISSCSTPPAWRRTCSPWSSRRAPAPHREGWDDRDRTADGRPSPTAPSCWRPSSSGWYKDAVIYEVHVRAFHDGNGDGVGDFRGLIEKLDYLQELGVTALWLLPFYPSPLRDDGYDISDYRQVHPSYGSLRDFRLVPARGASTRHPGHHRAGAGAHVR